MERLQKVIAQSGYTSRRKAEELIVQGRVTVNGEVCKVLGTKVSSKDMITIDGYTLNKEEKVYYIFYKPAGVVTTMHDEFDRRCIADYFKDVPQRVFPVGRLDYDTTGVLLVTNDGEFANLMMHPSSHLPKIYEVSIDGILNHQEKRMLEQGIYLEGVKTLPCEIKIVGVDEKHGTTMLMIRLIEGKNRQIKKMFESIGFNIKRLHRLSIGDIKLGGMTPGSYRRMKIKEVRVMRAQALEKKKGA
ncbi:pseudouridine synthase [Eggerthia catenaformis OT 569 = DSM 20559]|uniref:Pseudouridine synthase n=1 Tax=Eggerthia catenaformis OT 569 = DSM 20559 TaxID=999415 RepID=M2Q306_9FIRM|nr:pseudouridine synthase [Eggerthia catenaformis]EMD17285.1 pseudouridine synthase [Eggerthia catenaformis OT 569 = DSM 20559]OUC51487.1 pseudouridine synthase [Eggerthia catenaformis]